MKRHKFTAKKDEAPKWKSKGQSKVGTVMGEFKRGTLHSGGGGIVTKKSQAVAIALSEARKAGAKIPKKKKKRK